MSTTGLTRPQRALLDRVQAEKRVVVKGAALAPAQALDKLGLAWLVTRDDPYGKLVPAFAGRWMWILQSELPELPDLKDA